MIEILILAYFHKQEIEMKNKLSERCPHQRSYKMSHFSVWTSDNLSSTCANTVWRKWVYIDCELAFIIVIKWSAWWSKRKMTMLAWWNLLLFLLIHTNWQQYWESLYFHTRRLCTLIPCLPLFTSSDHGSTISFWGHVETTWPLPIKVPDS